MLSVIINGQTAQLATQGVSRFTDLVELIKSVIDPEDMIVRLTINGNELSAEDWTSNPNNGATVTVEVETDKITNYVNARLNDAPSIIADCFIVFRTARKSYSSGDSIKGNRYLIDAVKALKAFFEWYGTIVQLADPAIQEKININSQMEQITDVSQRLCQQQLYQSWWALSDTLEKELEPALDKLEDTLRQNVSTVSQLSGNADF